MKLDFLIIGAMKSGTTSLYADLTMNPEIFMPKNKEPMYFSDPNFNDSRLKKNYYSMFKRDSSDLKCGEGSTTYAMKPLFADVAKNVYSEHKELKIIYMVRDPLSRIVSHLYHDLLASRFSIDPNVRVFEDERYVNTSKYSYQIADWQYFFGSESILVVSFEDYLENRLKVLSKIENFLNVSHFTYPDKIPAKNISSSKLVPNKFVKKYISDSNWYKNKIKRILPEFLIITLSKFLLSRPKVRPPKLNDFNLKLIADELKLDIDQFIKQYDIDSSKWSVYEKYSRK